MSKIEAKVRELGFEIPEAPKPVASYIPAVRTGNLVFTSGQLPMKDGKMTITGIVGKDVTPEQATEAARLCAINAFAAAKTVISSLDDVVRVLKVNVYVASDPGYHAHPKIANGASDFIAQVFGESGRHARTTLGLAVLPLNAPVEVELTLEVKG